MKRRRWLIHSSFPGSGRLKIGGLRSPRQACPPLGKRTPLNKLARRVITRSLVDAREQDWRQIETWRPGGLEMICFFPSFCRSLHRALDSNKGVGGKKVMRQFSVGEVVTWIPELLLRFEAHGDYRIIAAMPDRDGDRMYRIKSPLEEYERVVREDLLVKSNGRLPEEALKRPSRRRSITLPTLQSQG
jgi:hypothetical protein